MTAKHEMKKELFERRYEVYKSIFEYLLRLKRDRHYRVERVALNDLLNLEVDVKLCGSRNLVSQIVSLREELEDSLEKMHDCKEYQERQYQNEIEYRYEQTGESIEEAEYALYGPSLDEGDSESCHALTDDCVDGHTCAIVCELRRSLGYREFRPAIWLGIQRLTLNSASGIKQISRLPAPPWRAALISKAA
ncbi:hypothetical protein [Paratractidigestivibacter sp.]|uniref:hypothetical protein n=1 Tax=Paratractidigestivibacter sp. TaxID=2847316 RepID=UPI002AC90A82|nr:hypothetical protein [Paratractidigestivibacter sp.]